MKNSIISTYRGRINCLRVFLRSLFLASKKVEPDTYEIVVTFLGNEIEADKEFEFYSDKLNLKVLRPEYSGAFWKTKALNHAFLNSDGNIITMIDIDSVVNHNFLINIDKFFRNHPDSKLAHRVRFLNNSNQGKYLINNYRNFDEEFICQELIVNEKKFLIAKERYTIQERALDRLPPKSRKRAMEQQALGNSHCSMPRAWYEEINGYDERFIGHGLEDLDFNLRLFRRFQKGTLRANPNYVIFHTPHQHESNWNNIKLRKNNRVIYRSNKAKKIIKAPRSEDWGKF